MAQAALGAAILALILAMPGCGSGDAHDVVLNVVEKPDHVPTLLPEKQLNPLTGQPLD